LANPCLSILHALIVDGDLINLTESVFLYQTFCKKSTYGFIPGRFAKLLMKETRMLMIAWFVPEIHLKMVMGLVVEILEVRKYNKKNGKLEVPVLSVNIL
jgi:hypothetical protein